MNQSLSNIINQYLEPTLNQPPCAWHVTSMGPLSEPRHRRVVGGLDCNGGTVARFRMVMVSDAWVTMLASA